MTAPADIPRPQPRAGADPAYGLAFAQFLAGLICDRPGYRLTEPPRSAPGWMGVDARFTVSNAVGEQLTVFVEHRGPGGER